MRLPLALASAFAYAAGRREPDAPPAPRPAPGAASEPAIVEPWRSPLIPAEPDPVADFLINGLAYQPGARLSVDEAHGRFREWAALKGLDGSSSRLAFLRRLRAYATLDAPTPSTPAMLHGYVLPGVASDDDQPNPLAAFLDEMLIPCERGRVTLASLHETYSQWCRARGETPFRYVRFANLIPRMREVERSHAGWALRGVRLADDGTRPLDRKTA